MTRAKQGYLHPDLEPPSIEEIDTAAADYVKVRDRRQKLGVEEGELKAELMELMHKHKLKTYESDGMDVFIVPGEEDVKVKKRKKPEEENGEEELSTVEKGRRHMEGRAAK